ncbi:hypothetical protein CP556_14725 [Natrinema sp. CBA1119]|nr:hypothetical protein CP556_14725 [Natrinema sp. CBA1119]
MLYISVEFGCGDACFEEAAPRRTTPQCAAGTFERDTYKDNVAIVCPACETPQVHLWDARSR